MLERVSCQENSADSQKVAVENLLKTGRLSADALDSNAGSQ